MAKPTLPGVEGILKGKPEGYAVKAFRFAQRSDKDGPEAVVGFKVLNEDEGIGECIVSVFGNEDLGGDVVERGFFADAIADKNDLPSGVWCHDWTQPVARTLDASELAPGDPRLPAKIAQLGGLYIKAQYNLDTQRGREAFSDVKKGVIRQYSFGYMATEWRWDKTDDTLHLLKGEMFEWSPVLVGMNPLTATLSAKSREGLRRKAARFKGALPVHHTEVEDGAWDGPEQEKNLPNDGDAADYKEAFAWVDQDGDPDTKAAYKFIHHFVGTDGKVGAASKVACSSAIAVLNGGRGGTTIPDGDRKGVWEHLAAHLKDAGIEADDIPPLKEGSNGLRLAEQGQAALDAVKAAREAVATFVQRAKSVHEMRRKDGRVLSSASLLVLGDLSGDLDDAIGILTDARDDLNAFMASVTDGDGGDGDDDENAEANESGEMVARLLAAQTKLASEALAASK